MKKHLMDLLTRTRVEQQRRPKGSLGSPASAAKLAAFRELHRQILHTGERVPWNYPDVDPDRKYRHLSRLAAAKLVEDGDEGLQTEVHRIYQKYVDDFIRCLELHEKRYNLGKMPAVYIPNKWCARFATQHLAQMKFHMALGEIIIDADEETNLIHEGTDPIL